MISELMNINLIKRHLNANNKGEVFDELAQILYENKYINNKEAFLKDIEDRELLGVTSMDGIAYPHSKSHAVLKPAIVVGVKEEGLDYGDEDGIRPTLFFMIASQGSASDHHIHVLQELFGKFCEEFIEQIHKTKDEHQVLDVLFNS